MDSHSQPQPQQPEPPRNYLNALLKCLEGNQTQPEQAGPAEVQLCELETFLGEFDENKSLSKESRRKLNYESEKHLSELRDLKREIQKRKDELEELEKMMNHYIDGYAIAKLLSEATMLLENGEKFPADFWLSLYDCLIGDHPELVTIDMTRSCYKGCLDICERIADSDASHQEDKDHAHLELAMHEVRMKKFETANEIASKIIDEYLQGCYQSRLCSFKKKFHLH